MLRAVFIASIVTGCYQHLEQRGANVLHGGVVTFTSNKAGLGFITNQYTVAAALNLLLLLQEGEHSHFHHCGAVTITSNA